MNRQGARWTGWAKFATIPLLAVVIGAGVAIASSPSSLTRVSHSLGTPVPIVPSPSPVIATPVPSVTEPGVLGKSPVFESAGSSDLVGLAPNLAVASADGGKTWTTLAPPSGSSGVMIDPENPLHGVAGGLTVQLTTDGGTTWKAIKASPPAPAPYQPFEVSPFDGSVWFLLHGGKLLRTRDAGLTWKDLGLPVVASPVMAAGPTLGQFYLAVGNRVFELVDNGQQITEQPALPPGVVVAQLAAVGGSQAALAARTGAGGLYPLTGSAWSQVSGAPQGQLAAGAGILVVGDGAGMLGLQGSVSYSTDLGVTWRRGSGVPYDQSVQAVAGQPGSKTFYAYCYGGDVYVSADGGGTWTVLSRALRRRSG
ncbi:MAG TPA: hypothetical protein VNF71_04855 [Acidimicrobiales bacterium]|nr:hypothetical protein [Acidimicrobiales bacterium]